MKKINVSTRRLPNTFVLVDDEDFEWLNQFEWHANPTRGLIYASRRVGSNNEAKRIYMHRFIIGALHGEKTDHRDGNGLNNQRGNLRLATHQQNMCNRKIRKNTRSGFIGVCWQPSNKKWWARVVRNGSALSLGYFNNPEEAAMIRDAKAIEVYGEFARLNFPVDRRPLRVLDGVRI